MNARDLQSILRDLIEEDGLTDDIGDGALRSVETFADAEVPTRDAGLVIRLFNGTEFQLTIVRSERGRDDHAEDDE